MLRGSALKPFLALLEAHRITRAFVVPPLVLALANDPAVDRYDVSSLRGVMSGAAPLDATLETACARRLECALIQGYGLTEASPVTHAVSDEPGAARPGTIGRLVPNTECRIVDPASGADLSPGEDGELLIRGPQVDRKSTRLNSSHLVISYAVFCLKKKKKQDDT